MSIFGQSTIDAFSKLQGKCTKQIGRYFCIPATLCNGLRILGVDSISQEHVRDIFYNANNRAIEADINAQMTGVSFNVIDAVERHRDYMNVFSTARHSDSGDSNIFEYSKSERAIKFIRSHLEQEHPVIVSTWSIPWDKGILQAVCCHMWLALAYDDNSMMCYLHDPASDQIIQMPFYLKVPLLVNEQRRDLEIGLRGRVTHSDYCCCALMKK